MTVVKFAKLERQEKIRLLCRLAEEMFNSGKRVLIRVQDDNQAISLDRFMSPLKEAVELDEIQNFYHICDLAGISGHASTFQVNSPISILIDGDGRIVTKSSSLQKISDSLDFLVRT